VRSARGRGWEGIGNRVDRTRVFDLHKEAPPRAMKGTHMRACEGTKFDFGRLVILVWVHVDCVLGVLLPLGLKRFANMKQDEALRTTGHARLHFIDFTYGSAIFDDMSGFRSHDIEVNFFSFLLFEDL